MSSLLLLPETFCVVLGEQSWSSCAGIPVNAVVSQLCPRRADDASWLDRAGTELGDWTDRGSSSKNMLELLILVAGAWNTAFLFLWRKRRPPCWAYTCPFRAGSRSDIFSFFFFLFFGMCSKCLNAACGGKKKNQLHKKNTIKTLIISAESISSHFCIQSAVIKHSANAKLGHILCK